MVDSNLNFFNKYACKACIGLVGGSALIDKSIRKFQKKITPSKSESYWSHAFIVTGKREDGHIWVAESDLEFHKKQINLGVQENRIDKYASEKDFPNVAILNFNLSENQSNAVIAEALNLVAKRTHYSIREIFGVLYNLISEKSRLTENKLAQENSLFCSAMVQKCFTVINFELSTQVSSKHLAPEDIYNTSIKHKKFELIRSNK